MRYCIAVKHTSDALVSLLVADAYVRARRLLADLQEHETGVRIVSVTAEEAQNILKMMLSLRRDVLYEQS